MNFATKAVAVVMAGLLAAAALTPALAGHDKKCKVMSEIDSLGKRLDKELFGWMKHKR